MTVRTPAPPYVGEGPRALWHVSEDPFIERFEPHVSATASSPEPRVWAVDTRHLPLYWFPRECPRGTFWATAETTADDAELLAGSDRVHIVETGWVDRMQAARVYAYRLAEASFAADDEVGGYWLSRDTVLPIEVVPLGSNSSITLPASTPVAVVSLSVENVPGPSAGVASTTPA